MMSQSEAYTSAQSNTDHAGFSLSHSFDKYDDSQP